MRLITLGQVRDFLAWTDTENPAHALELHKDSNDGERTDSKPAVVTFNSIMAGMETLNVRFLESHWCQVP